jgi:hypothetical protein
VRLVFRKWQRNDVQPPAPGEIHIQPGRDEDRGRRDLATVVLEGGVEALSRGDGPVERVVVDADPTLDGMLAAAFTMRLLAGKALPPGARAFARYAALVREGLNPGNLPLEVSLEGIYLAIRNGAGGDLTDGATAARFAADWSRMADCILQAAEAGHDPFTTALPALVAGAEFARERTFLARDQEVYRQDVERGERWLVKLPGDSPRGAGLLLRRPKSLLFKSWCRRDVQAPGGQAYLFLAVDWDKGSWVFSTDPVQRLEIKTLAETLQAQEKAADPVRAEKDPWFDGKPFGHTLVAAPKAGTVLPEKQVLRVVKSWAAAQAPGAGIKKSKLLASGGAAAALVAATVLVMIVFRPSRFDPTQLTSRGFVMEDRDPDASGERGNLYMLAVGVSKYHNSKFNLDYPANDARELVNAFRSQTGKLFGKVTFKPLMDDKATRENVVEDLATIKNHVAENDLVIVTVSAHGATLGGQSSDFFFLPHDFDEKKPAATGVFWSQVKLWLENLPCRVLIVMDTCHSGGVTLSSKQVASPGSRKAMMVIAACLSNQTGQESSAWRHGALTLALLEGITGKRLYEAQKEPELPRGDGPSGVINLHQLTYYVQERVRKLVPRGQAVVVNHTPDFDGTQIHVATLKAAGGS